jgi:hypothetical protein
MDIIEILLDGGQEGSGISEADSEEGGTWVPPNIEPHIATV